jgi:hypothetical protein
MCEILYNRKVMRQELVYLFQDSLLFVFAYEIGDVKH